jgi:hypothetical protein
MQRLKHKLEKEAKPGTYVLSNYHRIPGWTPEDHQGDLWLYRVPHSTAEDSNVSSNEINLQEQEQQ